MTRKSSCVNARGIPPAPHVLALSVGRGGGALHSSKRRKRDGYPVLASNNPPLPAIPAPSPTPTPGGEQTDTGKKYLWF